MRKTKEVLRLRFELGLGERQIARSCGMGLATVHDYLERAAAAGIGWPLLEGLSEEELESKLFGNQAVAVRAVRQRPQPDWKAIHEQLLQHRHLTPSQGQFPRQRSGAEIECRVPVATCFLRQRRDGSRASLFHSLEKPALAPLPAERFDMSQWSRPACMEDIDYRAARGLEKTVVRALAKDSGWVSNHENIFVIGPCGVGKSFLASGILTIFANYEKLFLLASHVTLRRHGAIGLVC
jgi:hypothetical protein